MVRWLKWSFCGWLSGQKRSWETAMCNECWRLQTTHIPGWESSQLELHQNLVNVREPDRTKAYLNKSEVVAL